MEQIINDKVCPICGQKVKESEYLNEYFRYEPKVNYLAHLVTHYRHYHITSWNKCWGYHGASYRKNWFGDYDYEKRKVNERAKRQIIRKGKRVLREIGIKAEHFKSLSYTEAKTLDLAQRHL
jgi:hypothetical protein